MPHQSQSQATVSLITRTFEEYVLHFSAGSVQVQERVYDDWILINISCTTYRCSDIRAGPDNTILLIDSAPSRYPLPLIPQCLLELNIFFFISHTCCSFGPRHLGSCFPRQSPRQSLGPFWFRSCVLSTPAHTR